jgi:hypothetical protein
MPVYRAQPKTFDCRSHDYESRNAARPVSLSNRNGMKCSYSGKGTNVPDYIPTCSCCQGQTTGQMTVTTRSRRVNDSTTELAVHSRETPVTEPWPRRAVSLVSRTTDFKRPAVDVSPHRGNVLMTGATDIAHYQSRTSCMTYCFSAGIGLVFGTPLRARGATRKRNRPDCSMRLTQRS